MSRKSQKLIQRTAEGVSLACIARYGLGIISSRMSVPLKHEKSGKKDLLRRPGAPIAALREKPSCRVSRRPKMIHLIRQCYVFDLDQDKQRKPRQGPGIREMAERR